MHKTLYFICQQSPNILYCQEMFHLKKKKKLNHKEQKNILKYLDIMKYFISNQTIGMWTKFPCGLHCF